MAEKIDRNLYVFSFPEKSSEVDRLAPPQPDNLTYRVNVSGDSNCLVSIEANGQSAGPGSSVSLEVTPDTVVTISCNVPDGWEFVCWTGLPQGVDNTSTTSFTVNGDVRASVYIQEPKYTVYLESDLPADASAEGYSVQFYRGFSDDVNSMQQLETVSGAASFTVSKHPGQISVFCKLIGPSSEYKYYLRSFTYGPPHMGNPAFLPEELSGDITYRASFGIAYKVSVKANLPDQISCSMYVSGGFVPVSGYPTDEDGNHYFYVTPVTAGHGYKSVSFSINTDDNFLYWLVDDGSSVKLYKDKSITFSILNRDYIVEPAFVINDATVTFTEGALSSKECVIYMQRYTSDLSGGIIYSKVESYHIGDTVNISTQSIVFYKLRADVYGDSTAFDSSSAHWTASTGDSSNGWDWTYPWNQNSSKSYTITFEARRIATFKEIVDKVKVLEDKVTKIEDKVTKIEDKVNTVVNKVNELVSAWNNIPCHDDTDPDLPHTINPI